jgi:hypothetical protein
MTQTLYAHKKKKVTVHTQALRGNMPLDLFTFPKGHMKLPILFKRTNRRFLKKERFL